MSADSEEAEPPIFSDQSMTARARQPKHLFVVYAKRHVSTEHNVMPQFGQHFMHDARHAFIDEKGRHALFRSEERFP